MLSGCGSESPAEVTAPPVAALVVSAGAAQAGTVGQQVATSPEVLVTDASGAGVGGVMVNFVVTAGGGSTSPLVPTEASGAARAPWTLGTRTGEQQRLLAAVVDLSTGQSFGYEFTATVEADAPAAMALVSGNGQVGGTRSPLPGSLVVRVTDQYDNPVPGVQVAWSVPEGGGSVSAATTTTSADGLTEVIWTLGDMPGGGHAATASAGDLPVVTFRAEGGLPSEWESLPPMPYGVRAPAAAAEGNFVYVIGGTDSGGRTNLVQIFDIQARTWSLGSVVPAAADWWNAVFVAGRLHLVGGVTDGGTSTQHWIYDPAGNSWTVGADLPFHSSGGAIATDGSKLYLLAGRDRGTGYSANTQIYDDNTGTWTSGAPVPTARLTWAGAWMDGRILAAGGEGGGRAVLGDLLSYDPALNSWTPLRRMLRAREAHGAAVVGDYFCVFGGRGASDSVECYLPSTDEWTYAASLPRASEEVGAVAVGDAVYVVGGLGDDGKIGRHAHRFTLR